MSIVKLTFPLFAKQFYAQCGRKYPEMVTFKDYEEFYARAESSVTPVTPEPVTVTEDISATPAVVSHVTDEVVTAAQHDAPSKYAVDFAKTATMTEKELMTTLYVLQQQLVKKRVMRSTAVKYKLTEESLANIFSSVMTKALAGNEVKVRSILAKHIPEEAVKGVAARELSSKQRKAVLSHLSQHNGVTLLQSKLGKAGLNAEFKGSISAIINSLVRTLSILKESAENKQEISVLKSRMDKLEVLVLSMQAGRTVTPKTVTRDTHKATVYSEADTQIVLQLKAEGKSVRKIEELTGINRGKVQRIIKAAA